MDIYSTKLDQLRQENAGKEAFLKSSGVLNRDGPQLTDQDLKWEALKETNKEVLAKADQDYARMLSGQRPKTPKEQHFDKVMDKYADRFKNHQPEFNEQSREGQGKDSRNRDEEMQR